MIPFNKPYLEGKELDYIRDAIVKGKISGDGYYTKRCHDFLEKKYDFKKVLLTTSCTDALEMSAILLDIKEGDEVIVPSYTFVSTANAFALRGAQIIFADSLKDHPNIDPSEISKLITDKTKAIVVVHYAGVPCDMDAIMEISKATGIPVVEDAAQAIDSFYKGKPLGSFGVFGTFSFHETKNIISGEGGALVINDEKYIERAEIIREKGTNRSSFFRGEVNKYGWVDLGSSFLPSDIVAAYLFRQLECLELIQAKRKAVYAKYWDGLKKLMDLGYVKIPSREEGNAHMFYLVCRSLHERSELIGFLKSFNINAVFHYLCLHESEFFTGKHDGRLLNNCKNFEERLVRLPLFFDIKKDEIEFIINKISDFYEK